MFIEDPAKLAKLFKGVDIQTGAKLTENCMIEPGCAIGSEAELTAAQLQKNSRIFGMVRLEQGVVVHENVTLVGPLIIKKDAILAAGVKVGVRMSGAEDRAAITLIGERALIGKNAEILGGVVVSQFCCVRANSLVIGDVPDYGLVGGSPAFLENLVCPQCGGLLKTVRRTGLALIIGCAVCAFRVTINPTHSTGKFGHICLPGWGTGEAAVMAGHDPRWKVEFEMGKG